MRSEKISGRTGEGVVKGSGKRKEGGEKRGERKLYQKGDLVWYTK